MFRLLRALLVLAVLVGVLMFLAGYRIGDVLRGVPAGSPETSGTARPPLDTDRARERGAEIGERVATVANEARDVLSDAGLTTKIMSKIALDDTVSARDIRVSVKNGVATLRGNVTSAAERARALQLARETRGITRAVDEMTVAGAGPAR